MTSRNTFIALTASRCVVLSETVTVPNIVDRAVALADALEQAGIAPWQQMVDSLCAVHQCPNTCPHCGHALHAAGQCRGEQCRCAGSGPSQQAARCTCYSAGKAECAVHGSRCQRNAGCRGYVNHGFGCWTVCERCGTHISLPEPGIGWDCPNCPPLMEV